MTEDTWQYQGRQQHGWWGHGTAPHDDKPARTGMRAADGPGQRAGANADSGRLAPVIKASAAMALPAMAAGVGAVGLASELTAGAVVTGVAVPLAAVAVLMAAGWGLYELMQDYDPRLIHPIKIAGHPEIQAVIDETQGKVALAVPGSAGGTAAVMIWKVETLPDTSFLSGLPPAILLNDDRGREMGFSAVPGSVILSEAGDKALQAAASNGKGAIKPQDDEERRLVEQWEAEKKSPLEIQMLLEARRNGQGASGSAKPDEGKVSSDKRNRDLPEQLWTRKGFREAVIANDKPLTEAIEEEKISDDSVRVHHIIPQASVRKDQELFLAGEWQPDRLDNGIALPKDTDAKEKFDKALEEERPSHGGSHQKWTEEVNQEIEKMKNDLADRKLNPGDPGYAPAVKEGLTKLLQRLREKLLTRQKVMIDQPRPGVA